MSTVKIIQAVLVFLVLGNVLGGLWFHFSKQKIISPKLAVKGHMFNGLLCAILGVVLLILNWS